eukprot:11549855-Alexandrium_andersonii.AAC.1
MRSRVRQNVPRPRNSHGAQERDRRRGEGEDGPRTRRQRHHLGTAGMRRPHSPTAPNPQGRGNP